MQRDKVILDRESFKALSSETRISILKALDGKRMTVTQLSEELKISKPALLKHMDALIEAKLISKEEKARKWMYYDLTFKGKNVLHPERVAVTVLLSTAIVSLGGAIFGFLKFLFGSRATGFGTATEGDAFLLGNQASLGPDFIALFIGIVLIVIFSVLLASAILIKKKYARKARI